MSEFKVIPDEQTPETPQIENISRFISDNLDIIERFKSYAEEREDCIGLAANQCKLGEERFQLRICAIKNSEDPERKCIIAIDPKVVKEYGIKRVKFEGCLTWKNKIIVAERSHMVDIEFYNTDGDLIKETHKGFQAQVWQHEINHLNGIEEEVVEKWAIPKIPSEKIGRNDTCPCGSGNKYKKCCIER